MSRNKFTINTKTAIDQLMKDRSGSQMLSEYLENFKKILLEQVLERRVYKSRKQSVERLNNAKLYLGEYSFNKREKDEFVFKKGQEEIIDTLSRLKLSKSEVIIPPPRALIMKEMLKEQDEVTFGGQEFQGALNLMTRVYNYLKKMIVGEEKVLETLEGKIKGIETEAKEMFYGLYSRKELLPVLSAEPRDHEYNREFQFNKLIIELEKLSNMEQKQAYERQ